MQLIRNLTPHVLNVFDEKGDKEVLTLAPTGVVPRCAQETVLVSKYEDVPVYQMKFGEVKDLPEKEEGVYLVVSRMVVNACPQRDDLLSPGALLRGEDGQPKGCIGLSK